MFHDFTPAPDQTFSDPVTEALVVTAENARIRGFNIQYDDTRLVKASDTTPKEYRFKIAEAFPEDATEDALQYTNCACFTYDCYLRAFGVNILSWTTAFLKTCDMLVWSYRATREETAEEQDEVYREFLGNLKIGDIIVTRGPTDTGGHAMLYVGNGRIIHSSAPGGDNYDYEAKKEHLEPDGSINFNLKVSDLFDPYHKRFVFKRTSFFGIARPSKLFKLEINEATKNRVKNLKNIYTEKLSDAGHGRTVKPGGLITYTYRAANKSGKDASLEVLDRVPEHTEYVSGGTLSGDKVRLTLNVKDGEDASVSFTVRVKDDPALLGKTVWVGDSTLGGVPHRSPVVFIGKGEPGDREDIDENTFRELFGAGVEDVLKSIFVPHRNPEYETVDERSPFVKYIVPTMYGGRGVVSPPDLFAGERTRGVLTGQIWQGDVIVCSDRDEAPRLLLKTKVGIFDAQTSETYREDAQDILYSLLGYYRFVILRPSQK
ncbi:MAG: DUF11 domain-containing protein [Clostridia bacterium]|nr:DUF11 domain-containing protein [Clostridia bacterium]